MICAEEGIFHLLKWRMDRRNDVELAHLFYDQNEPFIRSITTRWLQHEKGKNKVKSNLFWGLIADVKSLNMRDTRAIQAADILAWAFTRRLRNTPGDRWSMLATKLIGNRTTRGALTATQLDPITEQIMRIRYRQRHPT